MIIYLLYDYDEHGPEELLADIDPIQFRLRAVEWLKESYLIGLTPADTSVLFNLDMAISAGIGKYPLVDGWGGAVVEIVST